MADSSAPPPPAPPPAFSNSTTTTTSTSASASIPLMPSVPSTASSPYPYAFAPDIIRAHQKDAYFQGYLTNQISDLHRQFLGARSAHAWAAESHTAADLLYLCLTTLIGNRTLGEEYCGLVQVEADAGGRLPALSSRATYIAGSIILPYALSKALPGLRKRIRTRLQRNIARLDAQQQSNPNKTKNVAATWSYKFQSYILANLTTITSPASVHAVNLALFYFSGSYYEIAKRIAGLRYIFTHKVGESADRAGYEVLGVLLVIQMCVQGYLHVQTSLDTANAAAEEAANNRRGVALGSVNVSLDEHQYSSNNSLLPNSTDPSSSSSTGLRINLAAATHTPILLPDARYDLANQKRMGWIKGDQNRKCTLCLEELKDPAATQCGHVFCWPCIGDWVREKPECPLCRREALVQHILPLRAVGAA